MTKKGMESKCTNERASERVGEQGSSEDAREIVADKRHTNERTKCGETRARSGCLNTIFDVYVIHRLMCRRLAHLPHFSIECDFHYVWGDKLMIIVQNLYGKHHSHTHTHTLAHYKLPFASPMLIIHFMLYIQQMRPHDAFLDCTFS